MSNLISTPLPDRAAEAQQKLEQMGIEACVAWEESMNSAPVSTYDADGNPVFPDMAEQIEAFRQVVFVGDAYAQQTADPHEHDHMLAAQRCTEAIIALIQKGANKGQVSRMQAKQSILGPRLREAQAAEWEEVRRDVFADNPNYHGRRFGPDYAKAVAFGRVSLGRSAETIPVHQAA